MAVLDEEVINRKYGYSALLLRRTLHDALPETQAKNEAVISLMEEVGAILPGDLDTGKLSKWRSGLAPCNVNAIRVLLRKKSALAEAEISELVVAIDYLQTHHASLPDLVNLPNPPALAKQLIEKVQQTKSAQQTVALSDVTLSASAIVENIVAQDITIGDVIAHPGGTSEVSDMRADFVEIGNVESGNGAVARIKGLGGGKIKVGNVVAGFQSKKPER